MTCVHCANEMVWARVANRSLVCGPCFNDLYCGLCLEHTNTVGVTSPYNLAFACANCINNTPPMDMDEDDMPHVPDEIIYDNDELPVTNNNDDDIYDELPVTNNDIYDNITNVTPAPMDITNDIYIYYTPIVPANVPLQAPPANFDMNTASSVEHAPDYMNDLINAQVEYNGIWYFALGGQIYSIPYEIEIDDDYVREDIADNWDGVQWAGTIFGEYVAWY